MSPVSIFSHHVGYNRLFNVKVLRLPPVNNHVTKRVITLNGLLPVNSDMWQSSCATSVKFRVLYGIYSACMCFISHTIAESCTPPGKPHLPCEVIGTEGCNELSDESVPPYKYGEEFWPGPPTDFKVKPLEILYTNGKTYPAASFQWSPPDDGSISYVRGFELRILEVSHQFVLCRVFNLTDATWEISDIFPEEKKVRFTYPSDNRSLFFNGRRTYYIKLSSLPRSPKTKENFVSAVYRSSPRGQNPTDSQNTELWGSSIAVSSDRVQHTVTAKFKLAPEKFNFTQYYVSLFNGTWNNNVYDPTHIVTVNRSTDYHEYIFHNVCAGLYKIQIQPLNEDRYNDAGKCVCWGNGACKPHCAATVTDAFNVSAFPVGTCHYVPTTTMLTSTPSEDTTQRRDNITAKAGSSTENPQSHGYIAAIVIPIVILVVALTVLYVVYYRRKHGRMPVPETRIELNSVCSSVTEGPRRTPVEQLNNHQYVNKGQDLMNEITVRRRVFLLYFPDHDFHIKVITNFANFLHKICGCDVHLDMWCEHEMRKRTSSEWLYDELLQAERVIIVNSQSAYMRWKTTKANVCCNKIENLDIYGDNFMAGYQMIEDLSDKQLLDSNKILSVRFSYTDEKFIIPAISSKVLEYALMEHIEELFFHIHDIKGDESGSQQHAVGINKDDYLVHSPVGHELYKSILEAGLFRAAYQFGEPNGTGNGLAMWTGHFSHNVENTDLMKVMADVHSFQGKSQSLSSSKTGLDGTATANMITYLSSKLEGTPSEIMRDLNRDCNDNIDDNETVYSAEYCETIVQDGSDICADCNEECTSHTSIEV